MNTWCNGMAKTSAYFYINCLKMSPATMDRGFLKAFNLPDSWCKAGQIGLGISLLLGNGTSGSYSELILLKKVATFSAISSLVSMSLIHQSSLSPSP